MMDSARANLGSLESFRDHKVLKNGSALVLRLDTDDGPIVCKMAHANNALLEREAARIQLLRARYPLHAERIPALLGQGVIGGGLHRDKTYYLQEFVEGRSLADYLQSDDTAPDDARQTISTVVASLLDMLEEQTLDASQDGRSGTWMQQYIGEAFNRLLSLEHIGYLGTVDELVINGRACRSLRRCLDEIFASKAFQRLNDGASTISVLGHWNFHSENILLPARGAIEGFKTIDPDVRIEVSDPLFGLARLFYSYSHDTSDDGRYVVETDALLPNALTFSHFDVAYTWPEFVTANYRPLGTDLAGGAYDPAALDLRLGDPVVAARLDLSFLLCLLRGVALNHDTEFAVLDASLRTFRNRSVLLYLTAVDFANTVADRFRASA